LFDLGIAERVVRAEKRSALFNAQHDPPEFSQEHEVLGCAG
jgi:hypothetical protein